MSMKIEQIIQDNQPSLSLIDGKNPISISVTPGSPGIIKFSDMSESRSVCIECIDQPCIKYSDIDHDPFLKQTFKIDHNSNVCAVDAISWSKSKSQPIIDDEKCISCGVCVSRCPTKAIYLKDNSAHISSEASLNYKRSKKELHINTKQAFERIPITGIYLEESDNLVSHLVKELNKLGGKRGLLNPNLLIRNLLRSLGLPAEAYSQGVQYNTVDVVFKSGDLLGAGEVELGNAAIDAPRNLAVIVSALVSRYKIEKDKIITASFVSRLPQGREQYWMVIDDINNILNIKIQTLSFISLFILIWSRSTLKLPNSKLYLSQNNGKSIRNFLESEINRSLNIRDGLENQIEPSKLTD